MLPNKPSEIDVKLFIAATLGTKLESLSDHASLFHDLGVDGDDASDLINGFAAQFNVSLEGFDFQKYFGAETASGPIAFFVELFTKEKSAKLCPLRISDLVNAASNGKFSDDVGNG